MSGGQHRDDEVTRTELVGWIGEKQTENCGAALGRKQRGCTTVGVCPKGIKKELNTLDGADFVRDVGNRDYHHLSHSEIGGGKRIYQHLSEPKRTAVPFASFIVPNCSTLQFIFSASGSFQLLSNSGFSGP
jgi:hypothetical protein